MAKDGLSGQLSDYLRKIGSKGGKRRLETMTPEARATVAKKAAAKSAEVRTKAAKAKKKPPTKAKPAKGK
jgi:hypothetical protein